MLGVEKLLRRQQSFATDTHRIGSPKAPQALASLVPVQSSKANSGQAGQTGPPGPHPIAVGAAGIGDDHPRGALMLIRSN